MNNIRKVRGELNISLAKLSLITGISADYLCHLEKGTRSNPSYSYMKKIAVALNKTITEIFMC